MSTLHAAHPSSHFVIVLTRCLDCWRLGVALGRKTGELAELEIESEKQGN